MVRFFRKIMWMLLLLFVGLIVAFFVLRTQYRDVIRDLA